MDTTELEAARKAVAELEAKMLLEVKEKAALLGIAINGEAPKQKRARRTRQQIAADMLQSKTL